MGDYENPVKPSEENRKLFEKMQRFRAGFKAGSNFCMAQRDYLVIHTQSILNIWREYFSSRL